MSKLLTKTGVLCIKRSLPNISLRKLVETVRGGGRS